MNSKVLSAINSEEFGNKYPFSIHEGCSIITFQNTGSQQVSAFHPKTIEASDAIRDIKANVAMYTEIGLNERIIPRQ